MLTGIKNWVLGKIANITALIPLQASTSNQLADKAFVSSSVATATATFRGTYNVVTDLSLAYNATHSQIESALATKMTVLSITPDNNDYAFVQIPTADATPTEIARIEKYKYNGSAWAFEYELNNSGFTAAQWAAINSGATLELMGKLSALPTNSELATLLNGKAAKAQNPTSGHLAALDSNGSLTDSGISIDDNGAYDVTAHNSGATFASLSALLNSQDLSTLIPVAVRKGGMSIKFVLTSDNKYVQYMNTNKDWSTDAGDWEKVNLEKEFAQLKYDIVEPFATDSIEGITKLSSRFLNQGTTTIWGLNTAKNIPVVKKVSVSMEANSSVDLVLVNKTLKTVTFLATLSNSESSRQRVEYVPLSPISLFADEFFGLYNGQVAIYSLSEAEVAANAITYNVSNGSTKIETSWCVGIYLVVETAPSVNEVIQELKDDVDSVSNIAIKRTFGDISLVYTSVISQNWGLNKKGVDVVAVRLTCSPNFSCNVCKFSNGQLTTLGEISNSSSERHTVELKFETPIQLGENDYICFDGNNIPIVRVTSGGNVINNGSAISDWSLPAEIDYLEYNSIQGTVNTITNIHSILNGKKIAFLGDSITQQKYVTTWIENLSGAIILNYGVSGSHIASRNASDTLSFQARYNDMSDDVDMVVVWGGTNDFGHTTTAAPFGEFGDGDDVSLYTFYSGLHALFHGLYNKYRGKPIVIVTPLHHGNEVDTPEFIVDADGTMTAGTNATTGKTFAEYVAAIKEVAAFYSFFLVDAYSESGVTPCLESSGNRYYFLDGLHPNNLGANKIAKWMCPHLENILRQI
jgi:lysophospholipase L1-like esterase